MPFAAGGPNILARKKLSESLGRRSSSTTAVRSAAYWVLSLGQRQSLTATRYCLPSTAAHVFKKLPYDPQRDFQPITQLTSVGNVVVINPSVAAKNIQEFVALAKSKPGQLNYATTGTNNLLGIAQFTKATGINMVPIAYKGTGQAVGAIMAGEVQFFFMNPLVAIPHVKSGKLRARRDFPHAQSALPDT